MGGVNEIEKWVNKGFLIFLLLLLFVVFMALAIILNHAPAPL
jgi:hypothetical protein